MPNSTVDDKYMKDLYETWKRLQEIRLQGEEAFESYHQWVNEQDESIEGEYDYDDIDWQIASHLK